MKTNNFNFESTYSFIEFYKTAIFKGEINDIYFFALYGNLVSLDDSKITIEGKAIVTFRPLSQDINKPLDEIYNF